MRVFFITKTRFHVTSEQDARFPFPRNKFEEDYDIMIFFCDGEPPKGKNKPIKREGKLKRRHVDNNRKGMKYLWKFFFGFHSKATDIITTSNLNVNKKR